MARQAEDIEEPAAKRVKVDDAAPADTTTSSEKPKREKIPGMALLKEE